MALKDSVSRTDALTSWVGEGVLRLSSIIAAMNSGLAIKIDLTRKPYCLLTISSFCSGLKGLVFLLCPFSPIGCWIRLVMGVMGAMLINSYFLFKSDKLLSRSGHQNFSFGLKNLFDHAGDRRFYARIPHIFMMKKYIMPAVLSATICPGLGQMVKGEVLKGVGILVVLPLVLFLTVIFAVLFSIQLGIVLSAGVVAIYLWNIYDAYSHVPRG